MSRYIYFNTACKKLSKKEENNEVRIINKNTSTPSIQKKSTKVLTNNYHSENLKTETIKKDKVCICYSNYDESFVRNNICRFCNRYIENLNYENSIKKIYQQEMVSFSRPT